MEMPPDRERAIRALTDASGASPQEVRDLLKVEFNRQHAAVVIGIFAVYTLANATEQNTSTTTCT
jgi:hypothetical protein